MKLTDIKPSIYFRPGEDVDGAIKSAKLVWAKADDNDDEEGGDDGGSQGGDQGGSQGGGSIVDGTDEG